ncbi:hypothetical protein MMC32_001777 [Xylographa parallela]|nr:hypothetical protein [Xylographa parallela]
MEISYPSLSEVGGFKSHRKSHKHFRFFDLPAELRNKVLGYILRFKGVIDIDFDNFRRISVFLVSKRFHSEAAAVLYGSNTFRLFPTTGRADSKRTKPLISRFPPQYRANLTSLELRLGPFWTKPPGCWKVNDALGLKDATAVRILKVFVEIDPTHPIFHGFRNGKNFYTNFAGALLRQVISSLPSLQEVQFDKYPSVSYEGQLMTRLIEEAAMGKKRITMARDENMTTLGHDETVSNTCL